MIETKPKINRGNRGQLFRATWLSSARCSETFKIINVEFFCFSYKVSDNDNALPLPGSRNLRRLARQVSTVINDQNKYFK